MSPEVVISTVSAVVSLLGAVVVGWATAWSARRVRQFDRSIEVQDRAQNKAEQAEAMLSRYREPLLGAAHNLQARLYNIVNKDFLASYLTDDDPDTRRYARDYTVYVLAEYLCWAEIIRRDLRFLDLRGIARNRTFVELIEASHRTLSRGWAAQAWQLFRGQQRAIGELMMTETDAADAARHESIGYVEYCARLDTDATFGAWFARLRRNVDDLVHPDRDNQTRLIRLQNALVDLIEFLDPDRERLPAKYRDRLAPDARSS
ncbi:hypothetical protein [Virgisporangium aurantiacum]|uniref:DUF4760 domain-containing protein n=1 Tax=Virgisporangium aurantiacum TaxID=175570 RepID=A0A8J3Z2X5_9ACTN|nr:hypothetical protein [Virgisporangium aurantiacum]GIJ54080.1 hypothetical protein Vau01_015960 [Virgisporangium aurantiacum]